MAINGLDHITLNVADLNASLRFYVDVIGLREGDRPPFDSPGAWLYSGDRPIVHLVAGRDGGSASTGAFDHIALHAEGLAAMAERLATAGIAHEKFTVPRIGLKQIFIHDPDGVRIELTFGAAEIFPDD
ncbi:MAG: VOC family protein [Alphaproteobacteria bacterium]|jgi:catechol 2,3-dioxygenase-like lactoylglutathione lyase family enzyme